MNNMSLEMGTGITAISQAADSGTTTSNLYINIAMQGSSTLAGPDIDPKLTKGDRLLELQDFMSRKVNSAAESTLFTAGQVKAREVYIEILRTPASMFCQKAFISGDVIGPIKIWRADIINKKLTITEEITYTNCTITGIETNAVAFQGKHLDTLKVWFRFTGREDILTFFDQSGQPMGNDMSKIDFTTGTLQATGGGGTGTGGTGGTGTGGMGG